MPVSGRNGVHFKAPSGERLVTIRILWPLDGILFVHHVPEERPAAFALDGPDDWAAVHHQRCRRPSSAGLCGQNVPRRWLGTLSRIAVALLPPHLVHKSLIPCETHGMRYF